MGYEKYFKEEHNIFREQLRSFIEKELAPHADEWEEAGVFPKEVFTKMGELGFLGLRYPEEYGGTELEREPGAKDTLGDLWKGLGIDNDVLKDVLTTVAIIAAVVITIFILLNFREPIGAFAGVMTDLVKEAVSRD